MRKISYLFLSVILISVLAITSCKKDNNDSTDLYKELNEFIWVGLYQYYLWVDNVPQLNYGDYSTEAAWRSFLYKNTDSEAFFYSLLYKYGEVDRFSWIVDDYEELEASFEGISKSSGVEFGFSPLRDNKYAAVVLYTVKNGPAYRAGVKRGDIFSQINGKDITSSNYSVVYGSDAYSLSYATITDSIASLTGNTVSLSTEEVYEDPVYLDTVYTISNKKIGYLVYNGFMSDYDVELNNVFAKFKSAVIDELVLDLRYNLGGSGQSATYLASMIYGTNTTDIFYKMQCNELFGNYIIDNYGEDELNTYFCDYITNETSGSKTALNRLNLSKIHIIATGSSASASELVINCLKPYMNVTLVGSTTYGKNVGSMTIKDYKSDGTLNPDHKWAMQPIVFKVSDKNGNSDYASGLTPDIYARETRENIKILGDTSEILLKTALNDIFGVVSSKNKRVTDLRSMVLSKEFKPFASELYIKPEKYGINKFKHSSFK